MASPSPSWRRARRSPRLGDQSSGPGDNGRGPAPSTADLVYGPGYVPRPVKERWNDPDELMLILEAYLDVRDQGADLPAKAAALAVDLKREVASVETAIASFASKDRLAPKGKSKWTLTPLARQLWDAYGQEIADVRALAEKIRSARGPGLDKSNNHVTPPLWR
jgi:hypothetical protein